VRKRILFFENRLEQRRKNHALAVAIPFLLLRSLPLPEAVALLLLKRLLPRPLAGLHHRYRYNRTRCTVKSPAPSAT
jgi:hypothetical protein